MPKAPDCPLPKPHCPYCKAENPTLMERPKPPYKYAIWRFKCTDCNITSSYYYDTYIELNDTDKYYKFLKRCSVKRSKTSDYVSYKEWQEWAAKYYTGSNFNNPTEEFDNEDYRNKCRIYNKHHNNIDL